MSNDPQDYRLETHAVAAFHDRAAARFDAAAVFHAAVREQLVERLKLVRIEPATILDAGCATGAALPLLAARYPAANLLGVDVAAAMLQRAAARGVANLQTLQADVAAMPVADASVDLLFSNLLLHCCTDPDAALAEFARVVRPGGLLTFATLGPDTLRELRWAWAQVDRHSRVHYFHDMHDLGDALQRAGFSEPVMDAEYLTLTYADADTFFRELRDLGAVNATAGRPRSLTGRQRFQRLRAALEQTRVEGRLPATCEVVYGHAWAPAAGRQRADGTVRVPVERIGRRGDDEER